MVDPNSVPQVSTRGDFGVTGGLKDGVSPTDYGFRDQANFPGMGSQSPAAPKELVVFVHGIGNDETTATRNFADARKQFRAVGYDHPVVGYSWDSDYLWGGGWWRAKHVANQNGRKLAQFVGDYRSSRDTTVRLVVHSLGTRVACSALSVLAAQGQTDAVASLSLLGGAIRQTEMGTDDPPAYRLEDRFGTVVEQFDDLRVDNFWSSNDGVLSTAFRAAEWATAIGNAGASGPTPSAYADHDLSSLIDGHSAYLQSQEAIQRVHDAFAP